MSRERDVSCGKRGGGEEETSGAPRNSGGLRDLILRAALAHARGPRHGGWDPVMGWVRRWRHSRGGGNPNVGGARRPPIFFSCSSRSRPTRGAADASFGARIRNVPVEKKLSTRAITP